MEIVMVRAPDVNIYFTICRHSINQMIDPIVLRLDVQTPNMKITQISDYLT